MQHSLSGAPATTAGGALGHNNRAKLTCSKCNAAHVGCTIHRQLVHDYTGWWLDDGQPNKNPAKFAPTPEFADSE